MAEYINNYDNYNSLVKDWIFPYSRIKNGSRVILYGAGDVGQAYYEQIQTTDYCKIIQWIDKRWDIYVRIGMPVSPLSEINGVDYDYIVVAVADHEIALGIVEELVNSGIGRDKIVWRGNDRKTISGNPIERRFVEPIERQIVKMLYKRGYSLDDESILEKKRALLKDVIEGYKLILPRLVVSLTSVCTLKCKYCNNLMPYYEKSVHFRLDDIIRDINKVLDNVDGIVSIELIGGEPFSYPWIEEVLKILINSEKIIDIEITTNGTLIPNNATLELLKNNKVTVIVSKYEGINYTQNICKVLLESGVRYEAHREMRWIDSGDTKKRGRTKYDNRKFYINCGPGYYCKTLLKGKIYACARSASMYNLGFCNDREGFVDLYEGENLREKIREFYLKDYDPSCDYCDFSESWKVIPAAEQMV